MEMTVDMVAALVGGQVEGDGATALTGLNAFDLAQPGDLTFAGSVRYLDRVADSQAACVLTPLNFTDRGAKTIIRVKDPKLAFTLALARVWKPQRPAPGVHPTAAIAEGAELGADCYVGPHAVLDSGVRLGDRCVVHAGAFIGADTAIGADTVIHANVSVYGGLQIGSRVIIHAGSVIGADGFGYIAHEGEQVKVPQTGTVQIEDDVEIGANVCIDRATFGATVIRKGAKIDNLCQIAHNATIGQGAIVAGQSGVAGSTRVGDYAVLAAQSGLRDNIVIGERAIVGAKSGVSADVRPGEKVFGIPARPLKEIKKMLGAMALLTPYATRLARMARDMGPEKRGSKTPPTDPT